MFNKKDMSDAIYNVFDLFELDDFAECSKEGLFSELEAKMENICAALRSAATVPFEFQLEDALAQQFSYRGRELFEQRACLLHYQTKHDVLDIVQVDVDDELWLLEDMSMAVVHCVHSQVGDDEFGYYSDYRTVHVLEPEREDLFFAPEDLMESLNEMYEQYDELNATIYEL